MNMSVKIPALVLLAASTLCQAAQDRVNNALDQIGQNNDKVKVAQYTFRNIVR